MNSKKILLISLLFGLQGCADLYDSDTSEGSKAALIAVTSCDEGMTPLLAGDEISKTIPDTLLQMNYIVPELK